MKQELENFIVLNEKKIKSLTVEERTELGKMFLKGYQICENVRIDNITLQKIGEEVFYPVENLTNIK
jgi:hypothetical protein